MAVFADTGEEPSAVYRHLDHLKTFGGPPVWVRLAGKLGDDLMHGRNSTGQRFASIPDRPAGVGPEGVPRVPRRVRVPPHPDRPANAGPEGEDAGAGGVGPEGPGSTTPSGGRTVWSSPADLHQPLGRLTVAWDRNQIHGEAKVVKAWLAEPPDVVAEDFPGDVPDLNPDERVWGWAKYGQLANRAASGRPEL